MADTILVAYATRYGSTQEVAKAIAMTLRSRGYQVELQPASPLHAKSASDMRDWEAIGVWAEELASLWAAACQ